MGFILDNWRYVEKILDECISVLYGKFYLYYHLYYNEGIKEIEYDFRETVNTLHKGLLCTIIHDVITSTVLDKEIYDPDLLKKTTNDIVNIFVRHGFSVRKPSVKRGDKKLDIVESILLENRYSIEQNIEKVSNVIKELVYLTVREYVGYLNFIKNHKLFEFSYYIDEEILRKISTINYVCCFSDVLEEYEDVIFEAFGISNITEYLDADLERLINTMSMILALINNNKIVLPEGAISEFVPQDYSEAVRAIPWFLEVTISTYDKPVLFVDQVAQVSHGFGLGGLIGLIEDFRTLYDAFIEGIYKCDLDKEKYITAEFFNLAREGLDKPNNAEKIYEYLVSMDVHLPDEVHKYFRYKRFMR